MKGADDVPRRCLGCHQLTLRQVSGLEIVRESTGDTVVDMGPRFECTNVNCPQRRWVQQRRDDPDSLLPVDQD